MNHPESEAMVEVVTDNGVDADRLLPKWATATGHKNGLAQLQRICIDIVLFISIFAMVASGALELARLGMVKKHNYNDCLLCAHINILSSSTVFQHKVMLRRH